MAPVLQSHPSLLFLLLSDDSCSVLLSSDETAFSMQTSLTAKKQELQNLQSSGCSPYCWLSTEAPWNSGSCSPHRETTMCHDSRKTEKTERGRPTASEDDRQRRRQTVRKTDRQTYREVSLFLFIKCLSVVTLTSSLKYLPWCVCCVFLFVSAVLFSNLSSVLWDVTLFPVFSHLDNSLMCFTCAPSLCM